MSDLLVQEGFIKFSEDDSVVYAEKAFFCSRAITWLREKMKDEEDFNAHPYLVALTHYKLGLADLKFEDNELLFKHTSMKSEGMNNEFTKISVKDLNEAHRQAIRDAEARDAATREAVDGSEPPAGDE